MIFSSFIAALPARLPACLPIWASLGLFLSFSLGFPPRPVAIVHLPSAAAVRFPDAPATRFVHVAFATLRRNGRPRPRTLFYTMENEGPFWRGFITLRHSAAVCGLGLWRHVFYNEI